MRFDARSTHLTRFFWLLCCCVVVIVAARHVQLLDMSIWWSYELTDPEIDSISKMRYDWSLSTEENYISDSEYQHFGSYADIRKSLDYSYHSNYIKERQLVQDDIIDLLLNTTQVVDPISGVTCEIPSRPWITFTAGGMGAVKSWTIRHLSQQGLFPLEAFVRVDPDDIRHHLPEFKTYAFIEPELAGERTRKEAGMISEILTLAALEKGHNVLVDGSLRDYSWYHSYFRRLKRQYSPLRIGIVHITAPPQVVHARAASRAKQTGRVIPHSTLEDSLRQVPQSVRQLSPLVDFYAQLHNAENNQVSIEAPSNLTWQTFRTTWIQTCPVDRSRASQARCLEDDDHLSLDR